MTTTSYLGFIASPACVGAAAGALGMVAGLGVVLAVAVSVPRLT